MPAIGERLKELRKASGVTQTALADALGVHPQTVSKWERGVSEPDISQLGDLAAALGVPLETLLGLPEAEQTYTGAFRAESLGRAVSALRAARGESQERLAAAVNVSPDAVSRWERGVTCPDVQALAALAAHFSVPVSELYYGTGGEKRGAPIRPAGRRRLVPVLSALSAACAVLLAVIFAAMAFSSHTVTVDGRRIRVGAGDWFMPETPVREGYTLAGWTDDAGSAVTFPRRIDGDVSFTAVFVPTEYTVDYWLNGGNLTGGAVTAVTIESEETGLPVPQKAGATFEGWYTAADYSGTAVSRLSYTGADIRLYAKWSDGACTVKYELDGGVLHGANPETVTAAEEVALRDPVREGYLFVGWYDAPSGGRRYETVGGAAAANLTLYARWQPSDVRFAVEYVCNGGEAVGNPTSVGAGQTVALTDASRPGHDFLGWNTAPDGTGEYVSHLSGLTAPLRLYAIFAPREYLVLYVYEGAYESAEAANPNRIAYGDSVTLRPVYLYGHEFLGWFDALEGGRKIETIDESNLPSLSVLYARFTPVIYRITLDAGEGIFPADGADASVYTFSVPFGETFPLPDCVRAGYTFVGWTDEDGTPVPDINRLNIRTMTLTAAYRAEDAAYRIDFDMNGAPAVEPMYVPEGAVVALPEPQRAGYLFVGWYEDAAGTGRRYELTPAGRRTDWTLYAVWQKLRETGSSEHFTYEITESGTVTVTGYTGPTGNDVTVTVPARIDDKPVTAIGPGAFRADISAFCAIILPDGLVRLDASALSSLSVTEPLVIPAGVTEIGDRCFSSFYGAVSFAEGSRITAIGAYAFNGAAAHNILVLPDSVRSIGYAAFQNSAFSGIVLPEGLAVIADFALTPDNMWCAELYIPASVTYIGEGGVGTSAVRLGASEQAAQAYHPDWHSGTVRYDVPLSTLTLKDGDDTTVLTGGAFALPVPQKSGYAFLGWRDEAGGYADFCFIPRGDTVLTAVYAPITPDDGRSLRQAASLVPGGTYEYRTVTEGAFYFRIAAEGDFLLRIAVEGGDTMLFREDGAGAFVVSLSTSVTCHEDDVFKLRLSVNGLSAFFDRHILRSVRLTVTVIPV